VRLPLRSPLSSLRRRGVSKLVVAASIAVAALAALAATTATATPAFASTSGDLAAATNNARAAAGLPALQLDAQLDSVAQSWAQHLAATNVLAHNPGLRSQVSNWTVLGENVGFAGDVASVQQAFMNSAEHRANILDPRYTQMGVGSATSIYPSCSCQVLWVVVDFRRPATTAAPAPAPAPAPAKPVQPAPARPAPVQAAPVKTAQHAAAPAPKAATQGAAGTPRQAAATPATPPNTPSTPSTSASPSSSASAAALGTQLAAAAASPAASSAGDPVSRLLSFATVMSQLPG
jgi:uncharacterized protein YkwD